MKNYETDTYIGSRGDSSDEVEKVEGAPECGSCVGA
jgi:hypothetical protein